MTATKTASGQVVVDPDHYLDCRRPGWELYEAAGLIRFDRELGAKTAMVFVETECVDVLQALQAGAGRSTRPLR
jgi:hypothetical protein